jgi:hypothetical protein
MDRSDSRKIRRLLLYVLVVSTMPTVDAHPRPVQLTETGEAAQDKFVSGGAQQISERLAARYACLLPSARVAWGRRSVSRQPPHAQRPRRFTSRSPANQLHLSMPVRTVKSTADSQWVEATTMSGATFRARRLVLAIPPAQTGRIVFEPEVVFCCPINWIFFI